MSARSPAQRPRLAPDAPVLVTRLRFLGDLILTLPLLRALRAAHPGGALHYLAEPGALAALAAQPEIDVHWPAPRGAAHTLRLAAALRRQRFGAVIDLFANPRSALLSLATGAPIRIGEARRVRRHAYTEARRLVPGRSALEQHLDALRGLGFEPPPPSRPELVVRADESARGLERWRAVAGAPGIVLHLGATQPEKDWPRGPAAAWLQAARQRWGTVVVTTSPARPQPAAQAAQAVPGTPVVPGLAWRDFMAFLAHARAVVTVDGAVTHAAVALARPTVALFGPTDPAVWFPYETFGPYRCVRAAAGCPGCMHPHGVHDCMRRIAPGAVDAALAQVLQRGEP